MGGCGGFLGRASAVAKFVTVPVGQRFYDPISAEYFVKQDATMAAMVTGAGDGTVADEFELDDVVGVERA
jgi:hypothetical protein